MSTAAVLDPIHHTHPTPSDPLPAAPLPTPSTPDRLTLTHALNNPSTPETLLPNHILSSPYPTPTHTLDLTRLTRQSALFAQALQVLAPASADYAILPYAEAFDWEAVFGRLRELAGEGEWTRQEFYVVAFRSVVKRGVDRELLGELDEKSHEEAVEGGGLLKYWFGVPDGEGRNLATCFWHSRADAANGGKGPWHKKARAAAGGMYERIAFETRKLTIEEGVSGWKWEDWKH